VPHDLARGPSCDPAPRRTVTAIEDAKRVGGPLLYVAHRKNLVHQTGREFARLWPDIDHGRIEGGRWEPERHVVCASVQVLSL